MAVVLDKREIIRIYEFMSALTYNLNTIEALNEYELHSFGFFSKNYIMLRMYSINLMSVHSYQ